VRRLLPLALALAAIPLVPPAPARAGDLVVAREPGASPAARLALRHAVDAEHVRDLPVGGVEVVRVADGDERAALAELRARPGVRWAEPDRTVHAFARDALFGLQWALPAIGAPAAWAAATGGGQTVAVIDTGVEATHPDLAARLDGRGSPSDAHGHGTHVAGIVAATAGNGIGVAGAAPGARVLALQALGADGTGRISVVAAAEDRAADLGARVVNLSLGADGPSSLEREVIRSHPRTLFVAAAGNDGRDVDARPTYPCAYDEPNVLCVGAAGRDGAPAPFSNVGARSVDLFAPGTEIASTWPGARYATASGTSMAAPHAAAAAALLLERRPGLSGAEVRAALIAASARTAAHEGRAVGGLLDVAGALGVTASPTTAAPAGRPSGPGAGTAPPAGPPADGAGTAPALSGVRLSGDVVRVCGGAAGDAFGARARDARARAARRRTRGARSRGAACRPQAVTLRFRLARAAPVAVTWQRRACPDGRCRWAAVRRLHVAGPAGSSSRRLGAAPGGRPLPPGRHRLVVAALGTTVTTRAFAVARR
jgi:subtilisin family serine protease